MAFSFKKIVAGALAFVGALTSKVGAFAPLSNDVHTETAPAQEIGSTTSDGFLVYSMNVCTVVQTTVCETSVSTGAPAPSYGQPSDNPASSVPYEGTDEPDYPLPTGDLTTGHDETLPSVTTEEGYTQTISGGEPTDTGIDTATATPTGDDDDDDNDGGSTSGGSDDGPSGTASANPSASTDADAPSVGSILSPISILVLVVGGTLFI